jgi:hypothetical protein
MVMAEWGNATVVVFDVCDTMMASKTSFIKHAAKSTKHAAKRHHKIERQQRKQQQRHQKRATTNKKQPSPPPRFSRDAPRGHGIASSMPLSTTLEDVEIEFMKSLQPISLKQPRWIRGDQWQVRSATTSLADYIVLGHSGESGAAAITVWHRKDGEQVQVFYYCFQWSTMVNTSNTGGLFDFGVSYSQAFFFLSFFLFFFCSVVIRGFTVATIVLMPIAVAHDVRAARNGDFHSTPDCDLGRQWGRRR